MSLDQQLKLLSRSIDPALLGRRIRNARLVAGLTQADVGYPNASAAYICRIEAGQRRPGVALLAHVAERTGTSIEGLLLGIERDRLDELRLALARADLLLASGRITAASAMAGRVTEEIGSIQVPELAASAKRIRAIAMLEAGRPAAAAELLEELLAEDALGSRSMQLHTCLVRCHLGQRDLDRALEIGQRGLTLIDQFGLQGLPESVEFVLALADVHRKLDRHDEARKLCLQALEIAADLGEAAQLSSAYWQASTSESRRGATALAHRHTERAIGLLELGRFQENIASLREQVEEFAPAP